MSFAQRITHLREEGAYAVLARAQALAGNQAEAQKHLALAQKAGDAIKDEEDRQIFFDDFNSGEWHGAR